MVFIRLGNLSAAELEAKTGLEFTDEERAELEAARSGQAALTGPEDWHAFDMPGVSITIGSVSSRARHIIEGADMRKKANFAIVVYLDEEWKK